MQIKGNIKEIKQELRRRYRSYRESLSPDTKAQMDAAIRQRLFHLSAYRHNRVLFIYMSKPIEVDTRGIIAAALQHGKRVALPRCLPDTREMEFYFIRSLEEVSPGTFGVLEPDPARCKLVTDLSRGFCVVPGIAFDAQGYRLGYGKGYYDRFLSRFGGPTAGICYSACTPWNLPHGYYDRPVDLLLTEKYIRKTAQKNSAHGEVPHGGKS